VLPEGTDRRVGARPGARVSRVRGGMRSVEAVPFGTTAAGEAVELYRVRSPGGVAVEVATYGGTIISLRTPDRHGRPGDIVLGFETLGPYLNGSPYFGAIIGRYGNRIAGARFRLGGVTYRLSPNAGSDHLHGGYRGFDKVVWRAEPFESGGAAGVVFEHTSPDGTEGYPGSLDVRVRYTLSDDGDLAFDYAARSDRPTPVNLTQHSYFNLSGAGSGDVLGHELMLHADAFTPVDESQIPTGEIRPVDGTPFDFRKPTSIGARIDGDDEQLRRGGGYDHNFVLTRPGGGLEPAARVVDPSSGRVLEVQTTEPGVQLYTGNLLDGSIRGRGGAYGPRSGFCLETQHFPDSPNQQTFPSTILRPGEEYRSRTVLTFGVAS